MNPSEGPSTPESLLPWVSRIVGTGAAFPHRVVDNASLSATLAVAGLDTSDAWIQERTGIRSRHIAEPGAEAERNSSLAAKASIRALEMAGVRPDEIDLILFGTCTPDTLIPSTACWLQRAIGAHKAIAMDINAACSGFVYALAQADLWIRTGTAKTVLVLGSDTLSAFTNWQDRGSCILFGDGSGAAVVQASRSSDKSDPQILGWKLHADGTLWDLFHIPAGGSALPSTPELLDAQAHKMQMKGREIFKVAVRTLSEFASTLLGELNVPLSDVNWFIPHQANLRIIEAVAKRLNFPMERVLVNVDRFGNTSAATVPTMLDEAVRTGKIKKGDLVLLDVFGAGLTYGALLLRW